MGLINKLKSILFDEVEDEIPVITKETPVDSGDKKEEKRKAKDADEVIIKKIETPKRETREPSDDAFDMPKLKEDEKKEVKTKTFTFPVFDDEEKMPHKERAKREEKSEDIVKPMREKRSSGYNNAYDYSYGKYKGDYKTNRQSSQALLSKALDEKEEKTGFTPSPIISPVYGVLNENYKKEDIVQKSIKKEASDSQPALDLDSVRRKAYGTLEDEIEMSLSAKEEPKKEKENKRNKEILEEEGISINDLLVDGNNVDELEPPKEVKTEEVNTEVFSALLDEEDTPSEIELDDNDEEESNIADSTETIQEVKEQTEEIEVKLEKEEDKKEETDESGEEDLFDLIDSIYEGKGEA